MQAMDVGDFLRLYPVRAPHIMWFLGAGASAAAGMPTAWDMIWDFKRQLYSTDQRVSPASVGSLSEAGVRERLQHYFDGRGGFPPAGADDEYAAYFEAMYPDEADRRRYLEQKVGSGTPSLGHLALAGLLHQDRARIVWTTNFDRLIEDAVARTYRTVARLRTAAIENAAIAQDALDEGNWPLLVKLHGDFQSRRLKNTAVELQAQEATLEATFIEACRRLGLAVVGYSGRDASVMAALVKAVDSGRAFPQGLFWFHRGPELPLTRVTGLLERARATGIQAELIAVETFDELLSDVALQFEGLPQEVRAQLDHRTRRLAPAPIPGPGTGYPVIRLNALPVTAAPTTCRRVECDIGGSREVHEAVHAAQAELVVGRRQVGVLAFGADDDVRRVFGPHGIRTFDIHPIPPQRLRYDSTEHGMLSEALARALTRERPLQMIRRRRRYLLAVAAALRGDALLARLAAAAGRLDGTVPRTEARRWAEALAIRLELRERQLWLLIEPTVWIERAPGEPMDDISKEFVRDRLARRYNHTVNALFDAWIEVITGGADEMTVQAFGAIEGVDAAFTIQGTTAFSRRTGGRTRAMSDSATRPQSAGAAGRAAIPATDAAGRSPGGGTP